MMQWMRLPGPAPPKYRVALVAALVLVVTIGVTALVAAIAAAEGPIAGHVWLLGAVALSCLLTGALAAGFLVRRLRRPIRSLVGTIDQLGSGDYTQPVAAATQREFAELSAAVERMREKLRQTTITKNYLDVVLNSMTDAVLVTTPDGTITRANEAAVQLFGWSEAELAGRDVASLLAADERRNFVLQRAVRETREFMIKTRGGESGPVSMSGPTIVDDHAREAGSEARPLARFEGCIFVAHDITERKRAERRIRYLARYDTLTKIPNRMQFQHLLQQAIARAHRAGGGLALLYIDMDRFKEVNDTFGHASGDRVLELLTERLTRALSSETVLGRLAGDEFALFVDGLSTEGDEAGEQVAQLARTVLDTVGASFHVSQQEVILTVSIGVAFCPRDADNVIDLIRDADGAMH